MTWSIQRLMPRTGSVLSATTSFTAASPPDSALVRSSRCPECHSLTVADLGARAPPSLVWAHLPSCRPDAQSTVRAVPGHLRRGRGNSRLTRCLRRRRPQTPCQSDSRHCYQRQPCPEPRPQDQHHIQQARISDRKVYQHHKHLQARRYGHVRQPAQVGTLVRQ